MIYITGANGHLGRRLMKILPNALGLVRKPSGTKNEVVTDYSVEHLRKILKDATVVIHAAASLKFWDRKDLWEGNVGLTKNIISSIKPTTYLIFASSTSVYPKQGYITEKTKPKPESYYGYTKHEAERIVRKHKNSLIFRIAPMYGPEYEEYKSVISLIKSGGMFIIGDGKNNVPFVHVEDVAMAIKQAIKKRIRGTYILCGEAMGQKEIYEYVAKLLNVEPPKKHILFQVAFIFAAISEFFGRITGKKPLLVREHILALGSDRVFSWRKAKKTFGFSPRSLKKGMEEIIISSSIS